MAAGEVLVTAAALADALGGAHPPTVLDVRWRLGGPPGDVEFRAGHVPGASYVDLETALAEAVRPDRRGGRHPLPDPDRFAAAMRAAGVSQRRAVVVYDDAGGTSAARAWWLLRHHGHPEVALLDGGWAAWRDAGLSVDTGDPATRSPGDFEAAAGLLPLVHADGAARVAGGGLLLDVRAVERYRGDVEPIDPVAGHIPGAVSAPTTTWLDGAGRIPDADQVLARLVELGWSGEGEPLAAYCGSGVTAAHTVLVLASAGIDAALYPGSWSDWISDPSRPIATGTEPG